MDLGSNPILEPAGGLGRELHLLVRVGAEQGHSGILWFSIEPGRTYPETKAVGQYGDRIPH